MEELTIQVKETQGEIVFDLAGLKNKLNEMVAIYKGVIVTEDTLQGAKKDLAMLRKLSKDLNDRKIAIKKSFMQPYDAFEKEVKEALAIISEPVELLDSQVKQYEEQRREARKAHCIELVKEISGDYAEYVTFESVFNESWLNATSKDKDVEDAVQTKVIQVKEDLKAISNLSSEIEEELLSIYKTRGLSAAINRNTDYCQAKIAAEQKAKEEAERKERERLEAEAKKAAAEKAEAEQPEPDSEPQPTKPVETPMETQGFVNEPEPQGFVNEPQTEEQTKVIEVKARDWSEIESFLKFSGFDYREI